MEATKPTSLPITQISPFSCGVMTPPIGAYVGKELVLFMASVGTGKSILGDKL